MPSDRAAMEEGSIMDALGEEIIGVMSPVSICMLLVVLLVSGLAPPPSAAPSTPPVTAANLVYQESPSDSTVQKLEGSLLNAAVFVAMITAVTFLLVLLYYYNFTGFLRNYMRFSAFFVLSSMGGSIVFPLLRRFAVPVDAPTALLLLFNTAVVGVISVFSPAVPILVRQIYTVALGVIVATWLTLLPEWTTWTLLLALAAYDLVAVLAPGGPLRLLVDLASSRDGDIPALLYESRPTITNSSPPSIPSSPVSLELQPLHTNSYCSNPNPNPNPDPDPDHLIIEVENHEEETSPLVANQTLDRQPESADNDRSSELEMFDTTRGIRLGLGDFVFYSVLVGRAAMYDLMTVYACYLAIIAGLGCTLILLSVRRQALPALPISILLGVGFYFSTRLLMEPFVVGASINLVMF